MIQFKQLSTSNQIEVDCAKCALYIEDAVRKLPEINDCSISFAVRKMYVEIKDGCSVADVKKKIEKVGKKVDSDFKIIS